MLFANNCNTTLNGGITAIATSMVVTSATGFPSPTGSQYFYCTLADATTQTTIEIVKVTAVSGTTFTIVRGQDGTSGTAFASGAVVSLRLVRASLQDFPLLDEANTFTFAPTFNTALAVGSGGTGVTTSTGSVNNVLSTSPTLTTPIITTTIGVGGATPSASGAGITFPATQSASSDANTLDDYEEGTFTVTLTCGTSGTITVDASFKTLAYTKIGRMVSISGTFSTSAISSPTGTLRMNGLPFAQGTGNQFRGGGGYFLNGAAVTATTSSVWAGVSASTSINLYTRNAAGSVTSNAADITAATDFFINLTYMTD